MVTEFGISTPIRPLQPKKAKSPIDNTASPMVKLFKVLIPENHLSILVQFIFRVSIGQFSKAIPEIEVTELGISTLVRPLQYEKA